MLTKDFSGTYDYERGEAQNEVAYFTESIQPDYSPDESLAYAAKIAAHWRKVLTAEGFADFADEWNKLVPKYPLTQSAP